MQKGRFTAAQIIWMMKEQEAGMPVSDLCGEHGMSSASFC